MKEHTHIQAVILAGGQGTRLQPYTAEVPKPLVRIGERPIIEILLHTLRRHEITRIRLAVNHLAHLITSALGDGSALGMELAYSHEDRPLSTVGPLTLIPDLPEHFLVLNGDILTDLDYRRLYTHHVENGAMVTVATCQREHRIDYGVMEVGATGLVTGFAEKPSQQYTVSAGVYVFSREVLRFVPRGEAFGFDQLMLRLLECGEPIVTYPFDGYWLDIGRVEDYLKANEDIARIESLLLADLR